MLISAGNEEPTGVCGFTDKIHGHAGSNPSAHGPAVVIDLFAPEVRRNPWPVYDQLRAESPVLHVPPPFNGWMVFDYETVKWIMTDHASFSSRIPAANFSFIFTDPPEHTRLRNLISRAFTPRAIADLEPTIRGISKELFDSTIAAGQMEFAADFSAPLAMKVIAGMMGIAPEDWPSYKRWNDKILGLTFTRSGGDQAQQAMRDFNSVTNEMSAYLAEIVGKRRKSPQSDLLTRLLEAEVEEDRLTHEEILAFFRLLMFAGQETTRYRRNRNILDAVCRPGRDGSRVPQRRYVAGQSHHARANALYRPESPARIHHSPHFHEARRRFRVLWMTGSSSASRSNSSTSSSIWPTKRTKPRASSRSNHPRTQPRASQDIGTPILFPQQCSCATARGNRNVWSAASPQAKSEDVTSWSAQMYTAFVGVDRSWPGWNALRSLPH